MKRSSSRRSVPRRRLAHERLDQRQLLAGDLILTNPIVGPVILVDPVFAGELRPVRDAYTLEQNSAEISLAVLANDIIGDDYQGPGEITALSTGSKGGQIRIAENADSVLYTVPADFQGTETFYYYIDGWAAASVSVSIESPLRDFEQVIFRQRDEYKLDLLDRASFSDDYDGGRQITLVGASSLGADLQISDDGQSIIYKPAIGVAGRDSFTYIVDNHFVSTAVVDIVNVLKHDTFEVLLGSDTVNLDLLENDFQGHGSQVSALAKDAVITHIVGASDDFDVQISADGRSVNFTTTDDYFGNGRFRYVVNGRFEQTANVYVRRPVRDDLFVADRNGGEHSFDVLRNDHYDSYLSNIRGIDVVNSITSVTQGDSGGSVAVSADGLSVVYTPAANFVGTETFEYTADDKYMATVRVHVNSPVRNDRMTLFVGTETAIRVLANDFYGNPPGDTTITSVGDSEIGATIRVGSNGFIYYTAPDDAIQLASSDTFQYTVNEEHTATVQVYFRPITRLDYVNFDQPSTQTLYVLENDRFGQGYSGPARITAVSTPSDGGTVSISADGGYLIYSPGSNDETFTYTVDNRFIESVISSQRRRLGSDWVVADQNGDAITIDVLGNDFGSYMRKRYGPYPGEKLLTGTTATDAGGTVLIVDGKVTYTPPEDFVGADRFTYIVDDYQEAEVTVNVIRHADDDLVRVDQNSRDNELKVLINDLLGADYKGAGVITAVEGSSGSLRISSDGRSVFYTPEQGFEGREQFVYTVDGRSKATVTVIVQDELDNVLPKFESVEQLRDHLLELSIDRWYGENRYYEFSDSDATVSLSARNDFSETNVQVAGVDEDDLVETDGDYIYSLRGNELTIVSSLRGGDLKLMSQTRVEGQAIGMYLSGSRITVISRIFNNEYPLDPYYAASSLVADGYILQRRPLDVTTVASVFDVSDRAEPNLIHQTRIDGDFISSRRIDNQVFLVIRSGNLFFEPQQVCDDDGNCARETKEEFVARIRVDYAELLEDILPSYEAFGSDMEIARGGRLVVPEDLFATGEEAASLTVVVSLNMAASKPGLSATSGVMTGNGGNIYANGRSLYVFAPDADEQDRQVATQILKFDWNGQSGAIDFSASGTVAGTILNQFSADEANGVLRVTTSISNSGTGNFSRRNETGIFTLNDDKGVLEFVGSLLNLALGEDVKSVRYFGDRAFVTTFRNVDPLYAVDLSDATNPRLMGHASIPGFSSYAQVISEDRLLTVGSDHGNAMVSLFDISDFANPQLVDLYPLPRRTTSEANFDHLAFGWFARHGILALPTGQRHSERFDDDGDGYPEATRRVQRDALTILHVGVDDVDGEEAITLRGRIDHDAKVIRSVYIGDFVYSVGMDAIRSVQVGSEQTVVGEVIYPKDVPIIEPPPLETPLAEFGLAARRMLADHQGIDRGRVMIVAQEASRGMIDTVLRIGRDHYRYRGEDADNLRLVDDAFAFVDGWQNERNQWDVNDDGDVTALDALLAINALGRLNGGDLPADRVMRQVSNVTKYVDTNGDGKLTAVDALRVINRIAVYDAERQQPNAVSVAVYPPWQVVAEADDDDDRNSMTTIAADSPVKI